MRPRQPGRGKSGRAVTTTSNRACPILSDIRVSISSVVASIQCASSTMRSIGVASPRRTISSTRSAIVAAFRCAGVNEPKAPARLESKGVQPAAQLQTSSTAARCENSAPSFSIRVPGGSAVQNLRGARYLLDHRIERAVGMIGRALQMNEAMRFAGNRSCNASTSARLADPGFADQRDNLALALTAPGASGRASVPFRGRGRSSGVRRRCGLRRSGSRPAASPQHPPGRHRAGKSLQFVLAGCSSSNNPPSRLLRRSR